MAVLRELYRDLQDALSSAQPVTVAGIGDKLALDRRPFAALAGFFGFSVKLESVDKTEPPPQPLPRREPARPHRRVQDVEPRPSELGVDLGARRLGSEDAPPTVQSTEPSVGVLLESRDTSQPRSSLVLEYEGGDCESVELCGRVGAEGPRVMAKAWHAPEGVQLRVVFDRFSETVREFLDQLFQHAYSAALEPLRLHDLRIVFSTARTRLPTPYARVRIDPGVNVVFDAEPPAGLRALMELDTDGKQLSFFGVLPQDDDAEIILFSAPLFGLRSGSFALRRAFLRINAGLERADEEDGGFRSVRVTVRGTADVGEQAVTLYAPLVGDHELLLLRLRESGSVPATLDTFDPWMGGSSAWRDALNARLRLGGAEVGLIRYARHIEQRSGKVVSVHCAIRVPNGVIERNSIQLHFSLLELSFTVGFPHDGADAQVHVSASGTATVTSLRTRRAVADLPVTLEILPGFEWTVGLMVGAGDLPRLCAIFDVQPSVIGPGQSARLWCSLHLPSRGGPMLEVWPQENDA